MAYSFDQVFAADPANPANIAQNASVTIFAPGDTSMTPIPITDPDGQPLANPLTVNANGFGSAFMADIDRVAWAGGGFTGFFTSYDGMKEEAVAARAAAETAASTAGAEAAAVADAAVATILADADTAATNATSAAIAANNSAAAAAAAASLVGAPADSAIAAAVNGTGATKTALDAIYATPASVTAKLRPTLYDITSAKSNGTPPAFTSGQPTTLFGNAPLAITSGYYTHTPYAGANSAGYIQADMLALAPGQDGVYHLGVDVAWQAGTPGALALVLTEGAWTDTPAPVRSVAKVHMTMYGNGIHDCAVFTAPGLDKYMDTEAASTSAIKVPRFADVRDGIARPVDIAFNPATGTITIVRPDGSSVMKTATQLIGFHPRYAVFELYEPDGTTAVPAKFTNPRATTGPELAAKAAPSINDVARAIAKAPVPTQLLKTTTQYRPATTETILVPTVTAAEILGTGGVQITRVSGVIPASGKYVVRIKAYMVSTDARSLFWNLINTDTGATITSRRVVDGAEAAGSKWIDEEFYLTGEAPGITKNFAIHQLAGGSGTPATGITAGQNPSRPVTVEFIPVN